MMEPAIYGVIKIFCKFWNKMASGNKIYVFRTSFFKSKADFSKFLACNRLSKTVLRNLIILAERTAQSTARKENRSASAVNRNQRLFPKMKAGKRNPNFTRLTAETFFPFRTVYSAVSGTLAAF